MKMLPEVLFWLGLISVPFAWLVWYFGPGIEIIRPTLPSDLRGFSTVDELIDRLTGDERSAFPYEQELTLYVLLVASLWPNDHERLLAAARIFSGALNFHFSRWRQTKEWLEPISKLPTAVDPI